MTITSPTDEELAQFLALDDARTPGEWEYFDLRLSDALKPQNARYVAACTRIARAVVEELLERRATDAWTSEYMRQINAEEAD